MKGNDNKPTDAGGFAFADLEGLAATGKLPSDIARQRSLSEEMRKATGSILAESATDKMLRELRGGSLAERAARDALGIDLECRIASLYPKPSATEVAITKAHAEMAGLIGGFGSSVADRVASGNPGSSLGHLAEGFDVGAAIGRFIEPDPTKLLTGRSFGGIAEAARSATRFADADLARSVTGLQRAYQDRYDSILRQVTGIGSLGGIAAGLATGSEDVYAKSSRLFDDIAGRIGRGVAKAADDAVRRAHADLFPPLRPPQAGELEALVETTRGWGLLKPHEDWLGRVRSGITGLDFAWVREDRPELSLEAMARFTHLGGVVANLDPREATVTAELRARLGDYRIAEASEPAAEDPLLRVAEQYDRGFDPILSSLPTRVLVAMLAPFGLRFDAEAAEDEFGLQDLVGQMVRRLEARLMKHVRARLEDAYGDTWIEQVPADIRYQLRRRRRKDEEEGRAPSDLIAYADWAWWAEIINHGDNWRLFAPAFGSFDVLSETLTRLKPIRHAAAHPRLVGPEDLVLIATDGLWLLRCIGAVH